MSEHSAEYALVPDLARRLAPSFPESIPLFFWSSREGRVTTLATNEQRVKIVIAFARRPKVDRRNPNFIHMKINSQLLEYAASSREFGIPVLAGMPLISTLADFRIDVPCSWFDLNSFAASETDVLLAMNRAGHLSTISKQQFPNLSPLDDASIQKIAKNSASLTWLNAADKLKELRSRNDGRFLFFGGYKPFQMALILS
jgi:hypothetical protein